MSQKRNFDGITNMIEETWLVDKVDDSYIVDDNAETEVSSTRGEIQSQFDTMLFDNAPFIDNEENVSRVEESPDYWNFTMQNEFTADFAHFNPLEVPEIENLDHDKRATSGHPYPTIHSLFHLPFSPHCAMFR